MNVKRGFVFAVVAFLMLACGAASAALPEGPVRIGVVLPTSGPIAYDGGLTLNGVQMAVDEINASGGVNGHKLELRIEDSAGVPATAVAAMEKLVGFENVLGVIGDFGSSCTLAMMDVASRTKTPLITPISLAPKITELGNIWTFRGCDNSTMIAKAFTRWAVEQKGAKKWAFIAINTDYGRGSVDAFEAELAAEGGESVFVEYFNQGETDYYPIVTKLSAVDADALCLFGETVDLSRVVAQFNEMGLGGKMLIMDPTSGTFNAKFLELARENAEGIVGASRFVASIPSEAAQAFTKKYVERYGFDPEKYAQAGYDCTRMVAEAIAKADSEARSAIRAALAGIQYEGPQGKAYFDKTNQLIIDEYIVVIRDGKVQVEAGPVSGH